MSDLAAPALVGVLAAACIGAASFALAAGASRASWTTRAERAPDDTALRRRRLLPWPLRLLRALVAPAARRFEARLRALPTAALDRMLRRAGVAEVISCSELLLLGLPFALIGVAAAAFNAPAGVAALLSAAVVTWLGVSWTKRAAAERERRVLRELPFHLDMLALALESGATLLLALRSCTPRAPPGPLRDAFEALAFDLQTGRLRGDALAALQRRVDFDSVTALTTAIREAERSGAGLARVLRIQADQRRHERFYRAEKLAMQAPVRMLGPLVLCIFPCTFIVIGFVLYVRVAG